MKERPILMNAPMVRATLEGRKQQTRRIVKPQPIRLSMNGWPIMDAKNSTEPIDCPYGQPGDLLWVREAFFDSDKYRSAPLFTGRERYAYRSDGDNIGCHRWKPSIHMPRAASRILLEIVGVRVERLQDCSAADALSEGISSELIYELINKQAHKVETKDEYWINEDDAGQSWCYECGKKRIAELLKETPDGDYSLSGGHRSENDSQAFCEGCGAQLDNTFTDYGCQQELKHFKQHGFDISSPSDCYSLSLILYGSLWRGGRNSDAIHRLAYRILWESINGPGSWDANQWVWVVEFRRIKP